MIRKRVDWLVSARRSRVRAQSLLALWVLRSAHPAEIARFIGSRADRVVAALEGDDVDYARDVAPVRLGYVRVLEGPTGRAYAITEDGDRAALDLNEALRREARRGEREAMLVGARWSPPWETPHDPTR